MLLRFAMDGWQAHDGHIGIVGFVDCTCAECKLVDWEGNKKASPENSCHMRVHWALKALANYLDVDRKKSYSTYSRVWSNVLQEYRYRILNWWQHWRNDINNVNRLPGERNLELLSVALTK